MSTATLPAQLALALPADPRDLHDLAGPSVAEPRIARRRREEVAAALEPAACSCGGPVGRDEDGEPVCLACAKPLPPTLEAAA